jgi:hypothetical protein
MLAQMVEGPTVAEADLEDRTLDVLDHLAGEVETLALRRKAADHGIETGHAVLM